MKLKFLHLIFALCIASIGSFAQSTNCPTPTGTITSNITANSAQLSWNGGTLSGFYNVRYRIVSSTPGQWTTLVSQPTTIPINGLSPLTVYEWQVQAVCANSTGSGSLSAFSASTVFTTLGSAGNCPVPGGLTSTNITQTSALLSWASIAPNAVYQVRYRINSVAGSMWTVINVTGNSLPLTGLSPFTTYEWQVQAICANSSGTTTVSGFSSSAFFTTTGPQLACLAPTGLTSTNITNTAALLSWNPVPGAASYRVRYRTSPSPATNWIYVSSASNSYNLSGLTPQTTYEWQVQSVCLSSNSFSVVSAFSPSSFFTTTGIVFSCPVPVNLSVTTITATSAQLSWSPTAANAYQVAYRSVGSLAWNYASTNTNSITITGLSPATAYVWQVRSVCYLSTGIVYSNYSVLNTFQTPGTSNLCPAPTGLSASAATLNGVLLTWNAVLGAIGYNIHYRSMNTASWIPVTSTTNSVLLSNLISGGVYQWEVQAICGSSAGVVILSAWSATAVFTYPSPMVIAPNPAQDFIKINYSYGSIENILMRVVDVYGKVYLAQTVSAKDGINEIDLNISHLRNGLYYLEISGVEGKQTTVFFVQQ